MSYRARSLPTPLDAALGLADAGIPVVPAHYPVQVFGQGLSGCSCGSLSCAAPGAHPMGALQPRDATTDAGVLRYWWGPGSWRMANVATAAGVTVDVVELAYPDHPAEIAEWLRAHNAGDGPVIALDRDRTRFLGSAGRSRRPTWARLAAGSVRRLTHGQLVLLPPSRLPGGRELTWLTGPTMPLPNGRRLLQVLKRLPPPEELHL
jgi:hypothetical protein